MTWSAFTQFTRISFNVYSICSKFTQTSANLSKRNAGPGRCESRSRPVWTVAATTLRPAGKREVGCPRNVCLTRTEGTVTKGGRKFRANLRNVCKNNGLTPPFITNKFWRCKFRANPANFAQIRPMLFRSAFFGLTPLFITPSLVRLQLLL